SELPRARWAFHPRATASFARPGAAAAYPRREAIRRGGEQARAVPPAHHHALGQVLRHGRPAGLRAAEEASCAAIAAREGRTPDEVAYDYLTEAENRYLFFPVVNYVCGDHEPIREMLTDAATLLGLSDGGAHCASIVDAGVPTYMLLHWG